MTDLAERYGATSRQRRWLVAGIGSAVALVVLAVVVWSFVDHSRPEVRSGLIGYDVVSPREATAELQVVRSSDAVAATCRLHALAADHSVVGELVHAVESGPTSQVFELRLRTEREAVSVVSEGCTTPAQSRPR